VTAAANSPAQAVHQFGQSTLVHEPNRALAALLCRATISKAMRLKMCIRKMVFGAASALALASPAVASDLPVTPYANVPSYERHTHTYEYRSEPRVVVEEAVPAARETVVVHRPVLVAPPRVMVEEYPVYPAPRVYAYAGPRWPYRWGHRHHFHGGW